MSEVSTSTFGGVSHVVVTNGDITLECDVEDLRVVNEEEWGSVEDGYGFRLTTYKERNEFFLDKSRMVENEEGYFYTIRKSMKRPVLRTARIEVDAFTVPLLEEARIACGAPVEAEISTYTHDEKKEVRFVW